MKPQGKMTILFINHKKSQCGVFEFGRNIGVALKKSQFNFVYCEVASAAELNDANTNFKPDAIIYNYHPATMSWLNSATTRKISCPQIGIIHEVTQIVADQADNSLFNFHIAHDPTLLLKNPLVFKAGRLIPSYDKTIEQPEIPTIGSFGFAGKKGQKQIVEMVQREFEKAIIRLNIPFATFGDRDGNLAIAIAEDCRAALKNENIKLKITHDFLDESQVLDFLAANTINLFLYEHMTEQRGISGATDLALAVRRPLGITRQSMFRHLLYTSPSICVEDSSIKAIIANGIEPLLPFYEEWSDEVICWDYERIVSTILAKPEIPKILGNDSFLIRNLKKTKKYVKQKLGKDTAEIPTWIGDTSIKKMPTHREKAISYTPAIVPADWSLNNILDARAREIFSETINQMFEHLPDLLKRKIPEANVQQAYILDTVYKIATKIERPQILCVGSFEDSAAEFLKLAGFNITEIDPMINYDLDTFLTKPTTKLGSFDVIFSTSVIEHVEADEKFVIQIESLLKQSGVAILTCDYLDSFKIGDPKPVVDFRLYTQKDFTDRIMPKIALCDLLETPNWECPNPDFWYEGVNYTFATLAFKKTRET
jgi:SAM-dependent methyltransferase